MAAQITVNAVIGSNVDYTINTLCTLANFSNTGVTTWAWTLVDQPPGATDALSSGVVASPTFTPKKEGTYLVRLVTNATLSTEAVNQVVVAVRQVKSRLRVPAFSESLEDASTGDGWARSVATALRSVDALLGDPGLIVGAASVALNRGDVVRVKGVYALKATLPGAEVVPYFDLAKANVAADMADLLAVVEGTLAGATSVGVNVLMRARVTGLFVNTTLGGAVGDKVYVNNAGALSLTAGTTPRLLGRIVDLPSAGQVTIIFDGAANAEYITPGIADPYAGTLRLAYAGATVLPSATALGLGWTNHAIAMRDSIDASWLDIFRRDGGSRWLFGSSNLAWSGGTCLIGPYNSGGSGTGASLRINGIDVVRATDGGYAIIGDSGVRPTRLVGGLRTQVDDRTDSDLTIDDSHHIITYKGLTAARTVTLPVPSSTQKDRRITIKDSDGSATGANKIIVVVSGGSNIDGAASYNITTAFGVVRLVCTGSIWNII